MNIKITERGWGGHFIGASQCRFRRNTLIEFKDIKIVVSSVGLFYPMPDDRKAHIIGHNRYFETMAFLAKSDDTRYHDADVSKSIYFDSDWATSEVDADDIHNIKHDTIVKEISGKLVAGTITLPSEADND